MENSFVRILNILKIKLRVDGDILLGKKKIYQYFKTTLQKRTFVCEKKSIGRVLEIGFGAWEENLVKKHFLCQLSIILLTLIRVLWTRRMRNNDWLTLQMLYSYLFSDTQYLTSQIFTLHLYSNNVSLLEMIIYPDRERACWVFSASVSTLSPLWNEGNDFRFTMYA